MNVSRFIATLAYTILAQALTGSVELASDDTKAIIDTDIRNRYTVELLSAAGATLVPPKAFLRDGDAVAFIESLIRGGYNIQ